MCRGGDIVRAHAAIVALASGAVRLAARDGHNDEDVSVSLPDFESHEVSAFVRAIYLGQLPVSRSSLPSFQRLFSVLDIRAEKADNVPQPSVSLPFVNILETDSGELLLIEAQATSDIDSPAKKQRDPSPEKSRTDDCSQCNRPATEHQVTVEGDDETDEPRMKVFRCCQKSCFGRVLRDARAFNKHAKEHNSSSNVDAGSKNNLEDALSEATSRPCPLCKRPRMEHRNMEEADAKKAGKPGTRYK